MCTHIYFTKKGMPVRPYSSMYAYLFWDKKCTLYDYSTLNALYFLLQIQPVRTLNQIQMQFFSAMKCLLPPEAVCKQSSSFTQVIFFMPQTKVAFSYSLWFILTFENPVLLLKPVPQLIFVQNVTPYYYSHPYYYSGVKEYLIWDSTSQASFFPFLNAKIMPQKT